MGNYRVNNHLQHNWENFFCIVKEIREDEIGVERFPGRIEFYKEEFLRPIELSRDYLSLAGFRQHENKFKKNFKNATLTISFNENGTFIFERENQELIPVRYVHQLQNIFFDLTNEQLEINLIGS
jgi:hypothetical protein